MTARTERREGEEGDENAGRQEDGGGEEKETLALWRDVVRELTRPLVLPSILVITAFNLFISAAESVMVPVTQHARHLQFTPLENSYIYAGIAV